MRRLLARISIATAAVIVAFAPGAAAQVSIPALPVPTLPPQAQPVLEVLGPVVLPQCATATVVGVLAPALVGPSLPSLPVDVNTFGLFAPVFTICGQFPPAGDKVRFVCAVDDQVAALASVVGQNTIGAALPLDTRLVGPAVEVVGVVQDNLPQQARAKDLQKLAEQSLACRVYGATTQPTPSTPGTEPAPTFDEPVVINDGAPLDLSDFVDVLNQAQDPSTTPDLSAVTPARAAQDIFTGGPFQYPIVFVLPLLLLAIGAYVGRALTKPIS